MAQCNLYPPHECTAKTIFPLVVVGVFMIFSHDSMSINTHEARPNNYTTTKLPWLYSLVSNTLFVNDVVDKKYLTSFTSTYILMHI